MAIKATPKNVFGRPLKVCCKSPVTGFYRDGYCNTCAQDRGKHLVCAEVTSEFLAFSKYLGNDLTTPAPHFGFPGLVAGNKWCLCSGRWLEAHAEGVAPLLDLEATHEHMLEYISLEELEKFQISQRPSP